MTEIDYTKLNDRIVEQAYTSVPHILNEEQKNKLIQDKLARAKAYHESLKTVPMIM